MQNYAFWAAYDVPIHFGISQKSTVFFEKKITLKKVLPMKFDSFYVSLLSKYKWKNELSKAFFYWIVV
jgi:hypothetical protein